jgi:SAM-dependent methyltransferase
MAAGVKIRAMRSQPRPACSLCGSAGDILYARLVDRRFGAPGEWNFRRCRRIECRLMWLDPFPLEEDIGIAYEAYPTHDDVAVSRGARSRWGLLNRLSTVVDKGYLWRRWGQDPGRAASLKKFLGSLVLLTPYRRTRLDQSMVYLGKTDTGRVLEVGCGSGVVISALRNLGWNAWGIDSDPVAVAVAKRKGLSVSVGSLLGAGFPDAHFDAVIMQHVFEHLFNPIETLHECVRVLKNDGRLILVTPNSESLGHRLFGRDWIHLHPPNHLYIYRRELLKKMAEEAGLSEVRSFTTANWGDCALSGSWTIRRTGRSKEPVQSERWSRLLAGLQALLIPLIPSLGEECNLLAVKKSAR